MANKTFGAIIILGLLSAGAIRVLAAQQFNQPASTGNPAALDKAGTEQSGYVLKVTSRLVTLDVIATDSHGKAVRDLKPSDVQVFEERNAQQTIEQFEFIDKAVGVEHPSAVRSPANFYSNHVPVEGLKIPPTVLLLDSLNTQPENQMEGRLHLLRLLKTLPPGTPVAVFLLGSSLKVLQGFTSNETLLQAAVDQVLSGKDVAKDPADDPDSLSNSTPDFENEFEGEMIQTLQDFEKEEFASTIDLRAQETIDAFNAIGKYLSGIPGRKNLIWVSESFPFSILPNTDTGKNPFAGIRDYGNQITAAANVLTDAQVSVYPVDIVGLKVLQAYSAAQAEVRGRVRGSQLTAQLNRQASALFMTQGTMDDLAQDTGGKSCINTNDLSGCVLKAMNDSSAYYELSFYPQNVTWDGKYHKIVLKTQRSNVKLAYRRGYFAIDAAALTKTQPSDRLYQGCSDQLPSTAVHFSAQLVPPERPLIPPGGLQYLLSISTDGLSFPQQGDSRNLSLMLATCEFGGKNQSFRFNIKELTSTATSEVFRNWQAGGIPHYITVTPPSNTRRVRLVLLDASTGLMGALDIPVPRLGLTREIAPTPPPDRPVTPSFWDMPDKEQTSVPPKEAGSLVFHTSSGKSGAIDWNGEVLLYEGDIPIDQTAAAFFDFIYGHRFHCDSAGLVSNDPAAGEPVLRFTFHNHNGKVLTVDLKGDHPEYSGDLAIDPSAKLIFDQVWKSAHCRAP